MFEREAEKKLIDSFPCKINELNGTFIRFKDNNKEIFIIKININGREYIFDTSIDNIRLSNMRSNEPGDFIKAEFAKFISTVIFNNCDYNDLIRQ